VAGSRHEDFRRITSPFEGSLIRLRAVEESDVERIHELFNTPEMQRTLAIDWVQPLAGTRGWWEGQRRNPSTEAFTIENLEGELVGVCSLEGIDGRQRTAALGIWIGQPFWDRGYGTDAVRTLCRFGFREMNLQRIHLMVYDINERGRRAYEKAGFKEEGRLRRDHFVDGRYVDTIVMGLLVEDLIES
jgi:RimJ/RimL family protein N-acetyltransferase